MATTYPVTLNLSENEASFLAGMLSSKAYDYRALAREDIGDIDSMRYHVVNAAKLWRTAAVLCMSIGHNDAAYHHNRHVAELEHEFKSAIGAITFE